MSTRKTSVAIDQALLEAAKRALRTKTVKDTIEQAFLEVLRARARAEEVRVLAGMQDLDLANPRIMRGAWRG